MRNYSVETTIRIKAVATIAIVSVILSILIHNPSEYVIYAITSICPWLEPIVQIGILGPIEPMLLFWGLWAIFNQFAWKIPILIRLHGIPNLNGVWSGAYESSFLDDDGNPATGSAEVTIHQSFTAISIWTQFSESSESYAKTIGLTDCDVDNQKSTLVFSYENRATDKSVITDSNRDNIHLGFNVLRFTKNDATGEYVTFRNNMTRGYINLTRK